MNVIESVHAICRSIHTFISHPTTIVCSIIIGSMFAFVRWILPEHIKTMMTAMDAKANKLITLMTMLMLAMTSIFLIVPAVLLVVMWSESWKIDVLLVVMAVDCTWLAYRIMIRAILLALVTLITFAKEDNIE